GAGRRGRPAGERGRAGGPVRRWQRGRVRRPVRGRAQRAGRRGGRAEEHRRLPVRARLRPGAAHRGGGDRGGRPVAAAGRADPGETGQTRLEDRVRLRHVLWTGLEHGLPLQLHTGFGDPDVDLRRCDPLLLRGFLRRAEPRQVPIMLLHCYPYHREAGYLAQAYPHVYLDVGLAINYTGARAAAVVAESLELAPFSHLLFSYDAWGPAELHYLGAVLWRRATARVLGDWVA